MKKIYILLTILIFQFNGNKMTAQTIWTGPDLTFNKASNADWTLSSNQDMITSDIILTRQNSKTIYNYQWFQSTFSEDASPGDLEFNFWGNRATFTHNFTATGGPKGLKWAILDDTGSTTDWSGFTFYGTLGSPSNFYSFHNIASMIWLLEGDGTSVTSIDNDFNVNGNTNSLVSMTQLVGKKLGVWIEDEDIYFTLTFKSWGKGKTGGGDGGGDFSYTRSTDQSLGTSEFELKKNIKSFPNPSSELIQISGLKGNENYRIYNILGRVIKNGIVSNNELIDIRNFTNGLYFLKFDNGNSIKFIKK